MPSQDEDIYRAPASRIEAPEEIVGEWELATRWSRFAAAVVDGLLFNGVLLVVSVVAGQFSGWFSDPFALLRGEIGTDTPGRLLWGAAGIVLFAVLQGVPLASRGQTWGKRLLGIRIVDLDGRRVPFVRLFLTRYFARDTLLLLLQLSHEPVLSALFALANLLLIFGRERRCGHDLIAGTQVVRAPTRSSFQSIPPS